MPKCNCSEVDKLAKELVEEFVNGNIENVIDEISEYHIPNAITLALIIYKELPEPHKESFLNAFSIR